MFSKKSAVLSSRRYVNAANAQNACSSQQSQEGAKLPVAPRAAPRAARRAALRLAVVQMCVCVCVCACVCGQQSRAKLFGLVARFGLDFQINNLENNLVSLMVLLSVIIKIQHADCS
jgi:hypothetical protein